MELTPDKEQVRAHWEGHVCGSETAELVPDRRKYFASIDAYRYAHEPIRDFARFEAAAGKSVLEVGLGSGCDFLNWVRAGASAHGRDLTAASVAIVKERLALEGLDAEVAVGDAEHLDFDDNAFDIYYSWGVLHHTPNIDAAFREAHRVLKPGGDFKIMLYHYPSVGSCLVWLMYGPLRLRLGGPKRIFAESVESPGTRIYTRGEARRLVERYFGDSPVDVSTYLWDLDLLTQEHSTRFSNPAWRILLRLYPRWIVRRIAGNRFGTLMTLHAVKEAGTEDPS